MQISDSLFWIIASIVFVIIGIFPQIVIWLSKITGVQSPANLVFLMIIFVLLLRIFNLSCKLSSTENALHSLAEQYAVDHNIPEITIYHDYEGIAKWCTGAWKATKPGTIAYQAFYREAMKKVKVHFVKVKGHSNDKYNDMADQLAKKALGIL